MVATQSRCCYTFLQYLPIFAGHGLLSYLLCFTKEETANKNFATIFAVHFIKLGSLTHPRTSIAAGSV